MKIKKFEFNMFPVNCYVLSDETKEAVIIWTIFSATHSCYKNTD